MLSQFPIFFALGGQQYILIFLFCSRRLFLFFSFAVNFLLVTNLALQLDCSDLSSVILPRSIKDSVFTLI